MIRSLVKPLSIQPPRELAFLWDELPLLHNEKAEDYYNVLSAIVVAAKPVDAIDWIYLKSVVDFDIVIEIGYAQEQGQRLTLKQLFLLNISSRTTVRRKLAKLIERGIIIRRKQAHDHRASVLIISPAALKLLGKYGGTLTSIAMAHFK